MTRKTNDVRFVLRGIIPTKEQCDIQLSQRRVSLIEASAGAAKTTTLALRVGQALARGMAPEQILTLVFTPEAAAVMSNRLVEIGVHRDIAARLKVHTFEDFAAEFLASIENDEPRRLVQAEDLKEYAVAALAEVSEMYVGKVDFLDVRMQNVAISQFLDLQLHLKATMALQALDDELSLEEQAWQSGVPVTEFLWTLEYEHLRHGGFGDPVFRGPFDATYD